MCEKIIGFLVVSPKKKTLRFVFIGGNLTNLPRPLTSGEVASRSDDGEGEPGRGRKQTPRYDRSFRAVSYRGVLVILSASSPSQAHSRQLVLPLSLTRHLPPAGGSLSKGEPRKRGLTAGSCTAPRSPPRWCHGGYRGGRRRHKRTRRGTGCPLPSGCHAGWRGCPRRQTAA